MNISQATYKLIKNEGEFVYESQGKIKAKGKGEMEMYFVSVKSMPPVVITKEGEKFKTNKGCRFL